MNKTPRISVLVPCLNEELNIPSLVERIEKALAPLGESFELVLVDDGSSDNTFTVGKAIAGNKPWIKMVGHDTNRGMTEGWATALEASAGEYVAIIDADMQYRPEDIPKLWKLLQETGADVAQGWRESNPGGSAGRRVLSRIFSATLGAIFNVKLNDVKSGFLMSKREVMAKILEDRKHFRYFQHFPTIAAAAKGYSIKDTPVVFESRTAGQSFIKNATVFGLKALTDFPEAYRRYGRRKR